MLIFIFSFLSDSHWRFSQHQEDCPWWQHWSPLNTKYEGVNCNGRLVSLNALVSSGEVWAMFNNISDCWDVSGPVPAAVLWLNARVPQCWHWYLYYTIFTLLKVPHNKSVWWMLLSRPFPSNLAHCTEQSPEASILKMYNFGVVQGAAPKNINTKLAALHCTVLNDPYKSRNPPFLFCITNAVFSANNSVFMFLSVIFTSEWCLHAKSSVIF